LEVTPTSSGAADLASSRAADLASSIEEGNPFGPSADPSVRSLLKDQRRRLPCQVRFNLG
jgi:hypothetical protein